MLRRLAIGVLMVAAAYGAPVPFTATGVFQDGSNLSGIVTIDTATGLFSSADLAISGRPVHFTALQVQRTWPPAQPFLSELIFLNGEPVDNDLILLFPPVSLIGYTDGILCGINTACLDQANNQYFSNFNTIINGSSSGDSFVQLVSGSLEPAPEPSTLYLAALALAFPALLRVTRVGPQSSGRCATPSAQACTQPEAPRRAASPPPA